MKLMDKMIRDNNTVNEKTVIGIVSFCIMILFAIVDLITGYFGKELAIKEYIYESFLILTLGSFGIASVDKYTNVKHRNKDCNEKDDYFDDDFFDGALENEKLKK